MSEKHLNKQKELKEQGIAKRKEIESFAARHKALKVDHGKARAEIERLQQEITEALLVGTDSAKLQTQLQSDQSKIGSLETAITEAEKRLTDLESAATAKEDEARAMDFLDRADAMEAKVLETIKILEKSIEIFSLATDAYTDLATQSGMNLDSTDHTHLLSMVYQGLKAKLITGEGVSYTLEHLKKSYPMFFQQTLKK